MANAGLWGEAMKGSTGQWLWSAGKEDRDLWRAPGSSLIPEVLGVTEERWLDTRCDQNGPFQIVDVYSWGSYST